MAVAPSDIAVALGRPLPTDDETLAQWSYWINAARLLIQARLGNLDALDQGVLDYVVTEAVIAMVRKPDESTRVTVSVDDGSVSREYSSSAGRVSILDDWWGLLSPREASGAFTISPYGAPGTRCAERAPVYGWPS